MIYDVAVYDGGLLVERGFAEGATARLAVMDYIGDEGWQFLVGRIWRVTSGEEFRVFTMTEKARLVPGSAIQDQGILL